MDTSSGHGNSGPVWVRYHFPRRWSLQGLLHGLKHGLVSRVFARRVLSFAGGEPVRSVLELGCGSASTLSRIERVTGARCQGVDLCEPVVLEARRRHPALLLETGDLFSLAYPERSFDVVYSIGLLEHFSHADQRRLLDIHHRLAARAVVLMVPADSVLMNSILWVNRDLLDRSGTWADEEVFSSASIARKFPQYRFDCFKDRLFGNMIIWFGRRV